MITLICGSKVRVVRNIEICTNGHIGCSLVNNGHNDLFDIGLDVAYLDKYGLHIEEYGKSDYIIRNHFGSEVDIVSGDNSLDALVKYAHKKDLSYSQAVEHGYKACRKYNPEEYDELKREGDRG